MHSFVTGSPLGRYARSRAHEGFAGPRLAEAGRTERTVVAPRLEINSSASVF